MSLGSRSLEQNENTEQERGQATFAEREAGRSRNLFEIGGRRRMGRKWRQRENRVKVDWLGSAPPKSTLTPFLSDPTRRSDSVSRSRWPPAFPKISKRAPRNFNDVSRELRGEVDRDLLRAAVESIMPGE